MCAQEISLLTHIRLCHPCDHKSVSVCNYSRLVNQIPTLTGSYCKTVTYLKCISVIDYNCWML